MCEIQMILLAILIAVSGAIPNVASSDQKEAERSKSIAQMCSADEVRNPNPGTVKPTEIARVLVLRSTGNADIDDYFVREISKRTFRPLRRANKNVRSVAEVAVLFHRS
jgi:hypothetical protein